MKFEDEKVCNKYKDAHLRSELKQCMAITVKTNSFSFARKDNVRVERKQFPLGTAHALTILKARGSNIEYTTGDMNTTTKTGSKETPIYLGQFYTLFSSARSRNTVRILNLDETNIAVSELVKAEMEQ